jgi:hypothetical protein
MMLEQITARLRSLRRYALSAPHPHRPCGKLGLIIARLDPAAGTLKTEAGTACAGATLDDLMSMTGWQKHTVHGALSRLRARGFVITHRKQDGRSVYHLENKG